MSQYMMTGRSVQKLYSGRCRTVLVLVVVVVVVVVVVCVCV